MAPLLDERSRRRWAASEARMIGHGGVSAVAEATGLARRTIYRGLEDLQDRASVGNDRIRRQGGGRKSRITEDPTLLSDLKSLLEPATRGDPMRRQLWTSLSLRKLCVELKGQRARDQLSGRWGLPAQAALQLTGQPEIPRRKRAYGPEWSVRIHQQKGWQFFDGRPAGHLGRYEKEGVGRQFQECGPRMETQRHTRRGQCT